MKIAVVGATGMVGRHVVEILETGGHDVVAVSRSAGVDVITGDGLDAALSGVECVIEVSNAGTIDQAAATEFFTTAVRNLMEAGRRAGVRRMVVLSILAVDRFSGGYMAAKAEQERVALAGPIPVRILRAAQFHEFAAQNLEWGRQGDVSHVPSTRVQPVAARTVAEALADLATAPGAEDAPPISNIAGPREEDLVDMAARLAARRGDPPRVEGVERPGDPDFELVKTGVLLAGPDTVLAGPTFEEWLTTAR
ncbi:SDR family oxidoreductase [Actinomadura litoris]|uniref:NAD(P)H-binding protein n=1 Tax=Actinomadura litoris TaxID=2678616 RepID=A0A7K1L1X7_9ACTN|nr:NAD(P)H-binding protein [Actinomadura litoris]MUN38303.1 NAD(P)H-binding protein [Actinomadura litoris]